MRIASKAEAEVVKRQILKLQALLSNTAPGRYPGDELQCIALFDALDDYYSRNPE